jgi:hypothetical protein
MLVFSSLNNNTTTSYQPPTNIPDSDYDKEFFQRVVADAGRWAYGVVLVEVWVMNQHRTHLERPEGGCWVDPVARDYGQENNTKFQRLIDPTREDYFPPIPHAPGVGIPGALWAQQHQHQQQGFRGSSGGESSLRSGTIFGGGRSRRGGHKRNRSLFPFETIHAGTKFFGSHEINKGKARNDDQDETAAAASPSSRHGKDDMDPSYSPPNHTRQPRSHRERHRRLSSMGDVSEAVERNATLPSPSRDPKHRKLASDGDLEMGGGGRWTTSWHQKNGIQSDKWGGRILYPQHHHNLLPQEVRWRRISELANDPDQPFDVRIHYLEYECELGYAAGVSSLCSHSREYVYQSAPTTDMNLSFHI